MGQIRQSFNQKKLTDNQLKIYANALAQTQNIPQANQKIQMLSHRSKKLGYEAYLDQVKITFQKRYTYNTDQLDEVEKGLTDYLDYTTKQIDNTTDKNHRQHLRLRKKINQQLDKLRRNANSQKRR